MFLLQIMICVVHKILMEIKAVSHRLTYIVIVGTFKLPLRVLSQVNGEVEIPINKLEKHNTIKFQIPILWQNNSQTRVRQHCLCQYSHRGILFIRTEVLLGYGLPFLAWQLHDIEEIVLQQPAAALCDCPSFPSHQTLSTDTLICQAHIRYTNLANQFLSTLIEAIFLHHSYSVKRKTHRIRIIFTCGFTLIFLTL